MSDWASDPSGVVEALANQPKKPWLERQKEYFGNKYVNPIVQALSLPGDVYSGQTQVNDPATGHTSEGVIGRSADLAGLLALGSSAVQSEGTVNMGMARRGTSEVEEIFRGESPYNKGGSFYTGDKEFARNFTNSGRDEEILRRFINKQDIHEAPTLPFAGDERAMDAAMNAARQAGLKAIRVDEGAGQPPSIYVLDKGALKRFAP